MYRIFDAHCDTLNKLIAKNENLENASGMVNAPMMHSYNGYIQVFAAWVDKSKTDNPLLSALILADKFEKETSKSGIIHIDNKKTLESVSQAGAVGAVLALENGIALCGKTEITDILYKLGFRLITLTWNGSNELGDGAVDSPAGNLTSFGKEVVERMNSLGMVVDVSHLSEKGFYDVAKVSKKPFVASHSNAMAICPHPRNLTDDQIKTIISTNGVIGINLYDAFVSQEKEATLSDVIRHIEHIMSLGGENNLGIGTDFDGIPRAAAGLESISHLAIIGDELKRLGYKDETIDKIMYSNMERVFCDCLKS